MRFKYVFSDLCIVLMMTLTFSSFSIAAARNISVEIEGNENGIYHSTDTFYVVIKVDDATDIVRSEMVLEYEYNTFEPNTTDDLGGINPPADGMFGYRVSDGDEDYLPVKATALSRYYDEESGADIQELLLAGTAIDDTDGGGKHTGEQVLFKVPFTVKSDNGEYIAEPIEEIQFRFRVRQIQRCNAKYGWLNDSDDDGQCGTDEEVTVPVLLCAARNTDTTGWNDLSQAFYSTEVTFSNPDKGILAESQEITAGPLSMEIVFDPDTSATNGDFTVSITGDDGPYEYRVYQSDPGTDEGWMDYTGPVTITHTGEGDYSGYFEARVKDAPDYVFKKNFSIDVTPPGVRWAKNQYGQPTDSGDDPEPKQNKQWYFGIREMGCPWRYAIDQNPNPPDPWTEDFIPGSSMTRSAVKNGGDGKWYLHAQAMDGAGNKSEILTAYAILDSTPPTSPSVATSDPVINTPSADRGVTLTWNVSTDAHNGLEADGIAGYSWEVDTNSDTTPDDTTDGTLPPAAFPLPDTSDYYIHIKAVDKAGNWSDVYHYGPWKTTGTAVPGDVNGSGEVGLEDAIVALKVLTGVSDPGDAVFADADISGDGSIGIEEVIYVLQTVASLR